jgi:DNA-binding NtrC family response regulator
LTLTLARSRVLRVRVVVADEALAVVESHSHKTGAELVFVEPQPVDFAAAAHTALEDCGFRIRRIQLAEHNHVRTPGVPAVVACSAFMPEPAKALLRALLATGDPILALVKADDFERADWLEYAADVIVWPPAGGELAFRVGRWSGAPAHQSRNELQTLLDQAGIVGRSASLLAALADLPGIAACQAPVLITGETGTGKDLVARALHYGSRRRSGPFVPVNCGALPESLFENELFGHVKGAYTHALGPQLGLIARANQGSLFLDEIDALSLHSQVALLRFLQDGHYSPLGSGTDRHASVRVLAATNRPLGHAVLQGQFRDDLFYRLNILEITLPPLRARDGDIRLIADGILARLAREEHRSPKRLSEGAMRAIERQAWPGNVRELEAALHRAVVTTPGPVIRTWPPGRDAKPRATAFTGGDEASDEVAEEGVPFHTAKLAAIRNFEQRYLRRLIDAAAGNVSAASRMAGTERRTLGRLLSKHGIDPATYRNGREEGRA